MESVYFLIKSTVIIIQNYIKLTEYIGNIACIVLIFEYEVGFKLSNSLRGAIMGKTKVAVPKSNLNFFQKIKKYRTLLLMCTPAILFFLAFSYAPIPGIYVAFVKYNYRDGIFGSKFIGLDNFKFLVESGKLLDLTKNTICYNG